MRLAEYTPDYKLIDTALMPINEMMFALSEIQGEMKNEICSMSVESMLIEMPFELDIINDMEGNITLGSSPPTQKFETSFMPVFHKIKLNIEVIETEMNEQ
jgi:hypothetical protein